MSETSNYRRQERESRNLAFDYALGISILGLIPIVGLLTLKLVVATGLIGKMLWDISLKWKFSKGQDILAIAGYLFGLLGALAMAFMAWLTLLTIGLFIPYLGSFKIAAALFTLTWMLGQSTNQFYASGQKKLTRRQ
jgi:hypothetical protein